MNPYDNCLSSRLGMGFLVVFIIFVSDHHCYQLLATVLLTACGRIDQGQYMPMYLQKGQLRGTNPIQYKGSLGSRTVVHHLCTLGPSHPRCWCHHFEDSACSEWWMGPIILLHFERFCLFVPWHYLINQIYMDELHIWIVQDSPPLGTWLFVVFWSAQQLAQKHRGAITVLVQDFAEQKNTHQSEYHRRKRIALYC